MIAIILAAGRGKRLGQAKPKILTTIGKYNLLQRHLAILAYHNIHQSVIVTGYEADLLDHSIASIKKPLSMSITTLYNPHWMKGSLFSLRVAHPIMTQGEDILLMDGDVLYDARLLAPLCLPSTTNGLLFDTASVDKEAVKVSVTPSQEIRHFGKEIPPHNNDRVNDRVNDNVNDRVGESVGFFRLTPSISHPLARKLISHQPESHHHHDYEECLQSFICSRAHPFKAHDITGLPWIEIDFPEDLERARHHIWPQLECIH